MVKVQLSDTICFICQAFAKWQHSGGLCNLLLKNKVTETGEEFEDGRNIILVNGEIQDDGALGRLKFLK